MVDLSELLVRCEKATAPVYRAWHEPESKRALLRAEISKEAANGG